jgi:hypothetical protein
MAAEKKGLSVKTLTWLILLLLVLMVMVVKAAWNLGSCQLYGYQTDRTVKYAIGVGCMVKKDSGWTPKSELRTEQ